MNLIAELEEAAHRVAAASAQPSVRRSFSLWVGRPLAIVLGSLLVAVCAHVSIPLWFTPVPVTLQTFAVLLLGLLLSPEIAAGALLLYLGEGAAGLPVFSPQGPLGLAHLFGPTGGYLLAYPFAAAVTAWLRRRLASAWPEPSGFAASLAAAATGSFVILVAGAAWLAILTHRSPSVVLTLAVLPFLAGDTVKVAAAAAVAIALRPLRRSRP